MTNTEQGVDEWAKKLFAAIDAMDADGFADFFADDGKFVFGSFPPADGKEAVSGFVAYFFSTLKSLSHKLLTINIAGGLRYIHFEVTYVVADGQTVTIPGVETVKMDGDLISEYIIYLDPSPLQAIQASD
jgi:ketosteroid isomerase-like protein